MTFSIWRRKRTPLKLPDLNMVLLQKTTAYFHPCVVPLHFFCLATVFSWIVFTFFYKLSTKNGKTIQIFELLKLLVESIYLKFFATEFWLVTSKKSKYKAIFSFVNNSPYFSLFVVGCKGFDNLPVIICYARL